METAYTLEKKDIELKQEKRRELQRTEALLSQIQKYQTGIKDIQALITGLNESRKLSEDAHSQYKSIIKDYQTLERQFQEELGEIYAACIPSMTRS